MCPASPLQCDSVLSVSWPCCYVKIIQNGLWFWCWIIPGHGNENMWKYGEWKMDPIKRLFWWLRDHKSSRAKRKHGNPDLMKKSLTANLHMHNHCHAYMINAFVPLGSESHAVSQELSYWDFLTFNYLFCIWEDSEIPLSRQSFIHSILHPPALTAECCFYDHCCLRRAAAWKDLPWPMPLLKPGKGFSLPRSLHRTLCRFVWQHGHKVFL